MRFRSLSIFCLSLVAVAGCQDSGNGNGSASGGAADASAAAVKNYSLLKRTSQPFNFYVVGGGNVTLYDVTDDKELVTADLGPNSLLRFDPKTGLKAGDKTLLDGPVDGEDHTRELRLNR